MNYFKYIIYFFISLVDNIINLLCSLICYYPGMDLASSFLTRTELGRVYKIIQERTDEREEKSQEALSTMKEVCRGEDIP